MRNPFPGGKSFTSNFIYV